MYKVIVSHSADHHSRLLLDANATSLYHVCAHITWLLVENYSQVYYFIARAGVETERPKWKGVSAEVDAA